MKKLSSAQRRAGPITYPRREGCSDSKPSSLRTRWPSAALNSHCAAHLCRMRAEQACMIMHELAFEFGQASRDCPCSWCLSLPSFCRVLVPQQKECCAIELVELRSHTVSVSVLSAKLLDIAPVPRPLDCQGTHSGLSSSSKSGSLQVDEIQQNNFSHAQYLIGALRPTLPLMLSSN
jgi:hypothetical protein